MNFNTQKSIKIFYCFVRRGNLFSIDQLGRDQVFGPLNNSLSGIDSNGVKVFNQKFDTNISKKEHNALLQEVLVFVSFTYTGLLFYK